VQENPFAADALRRDAARSIIDSAFRLGTMTAMREPQLTSDYLKLVAQSMGPLLSDHLTSAHMFMWELANLVTTVVNPGAEIVAACGHDQCAHNHAPNMAFVDAAAREDFTAAMNVVKAVVKESNQAQADPFEAICGMFAATMASLAASVYRATMHGPEEGYAPRTSN
jgi:hypothetical protein